MQKINSYQEATEYLFKQLPVYQRDGKAAYKRDLNNILLLDNFLGHKHKNFKTIHVAGTNGKGSVSHMLASVMQEAGYKIGLYTSPHLKDFRERIRINGKKIEESEVLNFLKLNKNTIEKIHPSFFELTVALAFHYFDKEKVDIAIIETGLGGRLDSTNIITPEISVITNIGYDHVQYLGNTLAQIAKEKAGIIKKNIPIVIGETHKETQSVFKKVAKEKNSEIYFADKNFSIESTLHSKDNTQLFNIKHNNQIVYTGVQLDLLGLYQQKNILTVVQTLEILNKKNKLNISKPAIYSGLKNVVLNTKLLGRWQTICANPLTICDTAHNIDGLKEAVKQIKTISYKNLHIIIGFVNDKKIESLLQILPKKAIYYATKASIPRAFNEEIVLEKLINLKLKGNSFTTVKEALVSAQQNAKENDLIFIGGSIFIVAEVI